LDYLTSDLGIIYIFEQEIACALQTFEIDSSIKVSKIVLETLEIPISSVVTS